MQVFLWQKHLPVKNGEKVMNDRKKPMQIGLLGFGTVGG